jgi:threonine dehydrogenase-like Zn-dependent dehydrogenase
MLDYACAKLGAIAYHGLRLAAPLPHETIVVIGLGPIGHLAAMLYQVSGANVFATDLSAHRVEAARTNGITALQTEGDLATTFASVLPDGADIIVDATGVPAVLPAAIALAKYPAWDDTQERRTRYIIQGSYGGEVAISYQEAFMREIAFLLPRDNQPRDIRAFIDLIGRHRLAIRSLMTALYAPDCATTAYAVLRSPETLTVGFQW